MTGRRPAMWCRLAMGALVATAWPVATLEAQATPPTAAPTAAPTSPRTLHGIVGAWRTASDAPGTFTVDGGSWSGTTPAGVLDAAARRWFGAVNDTLRRHWSGEGAFPVAIADAPAVGDARLAVRFRMDGGASDQNAGIVFALQPNGEYLYVRYNTKDGDLALWRFTNGQRERIVHGTGHHQLPLGRWHQLVVTLHGRTVRAEITGDSVLRLDHTLDIRPAGRVGVWVKRDAVTTFRAFTVQSLAP